MPQGNEMHILHFSRGAQTRALCPETKTCVFVYRGRNRVTRLGCAVTAAIRLIEAGWTLSLIDLDDS